MRKGLLILLLLLIAFSKSSIAQQYTNPILAGFYPDPSICRVNDDYYIVTSSFAYFPGLPIFHSKDLVNWKQIGHAMNRNEQLDQSNAGVSRGLFAPTIRYNKGIFYIICTLIDKGGNFIITAKDPKGPWSNPVWLPKVDGIDPSLFFDENKAYIVYNSIPPENKSLYGGHRTIRMIEFDVQQMKVIGEEKVIVNGGVDITKNPVWIEAPHIFKKDNWYYLICAEGGTGYNHSEVVFRSNAAEGPYIPAKTNPILTQRHLDTSRKNPVTTAGHADFVETPDGKWYSVFLACRPYTGDHYNIGRETFMAPVEWKDGWPLINPGYEEVQYHYPVLFAGKTKKVDNRFSGNFTFRDDFSNQQLNDRFVFLRNPGDKSYDLNARKGALELPLKPTTVSEKKNPAFIGFRQSHHKMQVSVAIDFTASAENEKAGLLAFQNETHFYFICKSVKNGVPVVELYQSTADSSMKLIISHKIQPGKIDLKIEARNNDYYFYFREHNKQWVYITKAVMDAKFLSTKTAGGFVGAMIALYATSMGKETNSKAYYDWFEYKGDDDVFKQR